MGIWGTVRLRLEACRMFVWEAGGEGASGVGRWLESQLYGSVLGMQMLTEVRIKLRVSSGGGLMSCIPELYSLSVAMGVGGLVVRLF